MATMQKNRPMGATAPAQFAWQFGKTAASVCFVNQAERLLAETLAPADPVARCLRERIDRVKLGEEVIVDFMTDDQIVKEAVK